MNTYRILKMVILLTLMIGFSFGSLTLAKNKETPSEASEPKGDYPKIELSDEFRSLEKLKGTWEGENDTEMGRQNVSVNYRLASNGTALIETMFEDTPHEMISVYTTHKDSVVMTHYCSLGNQPRMKLKEMKDHSYVFQFMDGTNINPRKDFHMHEMKLTLVDDNTLRHEWTLYEGRKQVKTSTFEFKRKS